jgi:thioredoxin 1
MLNNFLTIIVLTIESEMEDKTNLQSLNGLENKQPWVLLYFSTSWCAPCKDMALIMDEISMQYIDQLEVVKVDVDEQMQLARECDVKGVPTLVLLEELNKKSSLIGGVTSTQVTDWLDIQLHTTSEQLT